VNPAGASTASFGWSAGSGRLERCGQAPLVARARRPDAPARAPRPEGGPQKIAETLSAVEDEELAGGGWARLGALNQAKIDRFPQDPRSAPRQLPQWPFSS